MTYGTKTQQKWRLLHDSGKKQLNLYSKRNFLGTWSVDDKLHNSFHQIY